MRCFLWGSSRVYVWRTETTKSVEIVNGFTGSPYQPVCTFPVPHVELTDLKNAMNMSESVLLLRKEKVTPAGTMNWANRGRSASHFQAGTIPPCFEHSRSHKVKWPLVGAFKENISIIPT